MYDIFLETLACQQIDRYAKANDLSVEEAEDIKRSCYDNSNKYLGRKTQEAIDSYWINLCLNNDSHKNKCVDALMLWSETPEGQDFWCDVSDY
ncbi:MAG: hypothetical protein [Bacteriophage sp.]|nr:MAG: hypothetical protein [Bacteriophage sp.]